MTPLKIFTLICYPPVAVLTFALAANMLFGRKWTLPLRRRIPYALAEILLGCAVIVAMLVIVF